MLNPTIVELIFIRACVLLLQYAPMFYVLLPSPASIILLAAELIYSLVVLARFESRLSLPAKHPPDTRQEREALFQRCIQNIPDPDRYLSLWFLGADLADIKQDNVRDFFLWAFLDRENAEIDVETREELDGYVARVEHIIGRPLSPGRGNVRSMRLTFDRIQTRYRSVLWYLVVGLVDSVTHLRMTWHHFSFYSVSIKTNMLHVFPPRPMASLERLQRQSPSDDLSYWYRPASTREPTLPIVFFHGIGIGLHPYVSFLAALPSTSPVLAIEILPICMRITKTNILARQDFVHELKKILCRHGIDRFVLSGHSYGTILATHVLLDAELSVQVEGVVLIDPVSLLLHLPDVAYNFTRRMPRTANEWQLWYMASMDPGIALVLGRHFFWRENIIWKDQLVKNIACRRRTAICLASRDLIVNSTAVARYLIHDEGLTELGGYGSSAQDAELALFQEKGGLSTRSGMELLWFQMDHSQMFEKNDDWVRIVDVLQRFCGSP